MKVRFRGGDLATLPATERPYVSPQQLFLTTGRAYSVYALSVYEGVTFVQIIDDTNDPTFKPRGLFDVDDATVPPDWICNVFPDGPLQLVLGPDFIAKDAAAYGRMIDRREDAWTQFWKRVEAERPPAEDD